MRRAGGGRRAVRLVMWLAGGIVVLLGLAQVFLPKIAASRISSRVSKYGTVESVHVSAFPAVKLLWGSADSASVQASELNVSPAQSAKLLYEARGVHDFDLRASSVREGPLSVSDLHLQKRGDALHAQALVSAAGVKAALPEGFGVELLRSEGGQVEVHASGGLFGIGASVNAVAEASDGRLVVHPRGLLIEGLALTLFSNQHVYVEGVGARASGEHGYVLSIDARLH